MYDYMRSYGIMPPPEATAALIRALARGGGGSGETLSLLADMRRAADSRGKGRRAARAEGDGRAAMMTAQSAGYSGAIEACAAAGEWQKAVTLLDDMRNVSRIYRVIGDIFRRLLSLLAGLSGSRSRILPVNYGCGRGSGGRHHPGSCVGKWEGVCLT